MELTQLEILYIVPLILGVLIDSIVGDPYKLPHPIRLFGNIIALFERKLNRGSHRVLAGAFTAIFLISVTFALIFTIDQLLAPYELPRIIWRTVVVFYSLANRSLIDEGIKVEKAIGTGEISKAREQVGYIVGRKTGNLTFSQIRIATLETLSENLSDGVIAPLFYYAIGGVPLMLTYKMVNTLDSMIGYKNSRYLKFGRFAAIIDDIFNYIPARITAILIAIAGGKKKGFTHIFKYGSKHSSPNAGYPESALAGVLDCRFGGPTEYDGYTSDKPYIGDHNREVTKEDLHRSVKINIISTAIATTLIICL